MKAAVLVALGAFFSSVAAWSAPVAAPATVATPCPPLKQKWYVVLRGVRHDQSIFDGEVFVCTDGPVDTESAIWQLTADVLAALRREAKTASDRPERVIIVNLLPMKQ